jgi:geranylgeranyl diphosphate synthase type II
VPPGTPSEVSETLQEYGAIVREGMESYFPKGDPKSYLYDLLPEYPRRGGKMFRPSLCIATARAFGASLQSALATAVAIELLHNALLIHDDIEDASEQRRDRPTLNSSHGVPLALNAGDALGLLSLRPLVENVERIGPRLAAAVLRETERMAWETVEGQAMELGWRRDNRQDLGDADYLIMVLKKTCWLTSIHPARVGALVATRDAISLEPFIRFGFFLGAAFQIQDDILNLEPHDGYGKEANGDLFEGKRTLMLMHALRSASAPDRQQLCALLAPDRESRSAEQVAWIRRLIDLHGSIAYARAVAHGLAGAALHEFSHTFADLPDTRDKRFLGGLASWIFHRV